jgi:CheY-like chemotaxis protein
VRTAQASETVRIHARTRRNRVRIWATCGAGILHNASAMSCTVLLVEDDPDVLGMMDQLLRLEGFTPVTAMNGREALRLLKTGLQPEVILLDLMMPVMDGWAFRRAQRADADIAGIPVIVLTAAAHISHDELEAVAVFRKPVPLDDVIAVLTRLCSEPKRLNDPTQHHIA